MVNDFFTKKLLPWVSARVTLGYQNKGKGAAIKVPTTERTPSVRIWEAHVRSLWRSLQIQLAEGERYDHSCDGFDWKLCRMVCEATLWPADQSHTERLNILRGMAVSDASFESELWRSHCDALRYQFAEDRKIKILVMAHLNQYEDLESLNVRAIAALGIIEQSVDIEHLVKSRDKILDAIDTLSAYFRESHVLPFPLPNTA